MKSGSIEGPATIYQPASPSRGHASRGANLTLPQDRFPATVVVAAAVPLVQEGGEEEEEEEEEDPRPRKEEEQSVS